MKPEAAGSAPEPTQDAEPSGRKPPSEAKAPAPAPVKTSQMPWRQVAVVVGIAAATLLIVSGGFWFISSRGGNDAAALDPRAATAQGALDHAVAEARLAGADKVALQRAALVTDAAVVAQNVPGQALGSYAGWVFKKAMGVLAESASDCELDLRVSLHSDAAPDFEVSPSQGKPDAALLQRLRRELETVDPLHTSAKDVSFTAHLAVKTGAPVAAEPARPKSAKLDIDSVRQACGVEIGMFCNAQQSQPGALVGCLRGHAHDLLDACRQALAIPSPKE
jgi:hypothetical protein